MENFFFFFAAQHPRRPCARSLAHAAQGDAVTLPSPVAVTHALVKAGRTLRFSLNRDAKMNLLLQETELVVQKATNYWIMICFGALLAKPSTKVLILRLFCSFGWIFLGLFFFYLLIYKKVIIVLSPIFSESLFKGIISFLPLVNLNRMRRF